MLSLRLFMRYKYRIRLFYSIVFLVVGLIIGYYLSSYGISSLMNSFSNKIAASDTAVKQASGQDEANVFNVGIILPESESSVKDAIELSIMEINLESKKKVTSAYENADCSSKDVIDAIDSLKEKNIKFAYGIFCNETINTAISTSKENNMVLLIPAADKISAKDFSSSLIKIKVYDNATTITNRFMLAYRTLYKRNADRYDAVSYDAINIINMMLNNKQVKDYPGIIGIINIEEKNSAYLIILE